MRIIREGKPASKKLLRGTCSQCKCIVEVEQGECKELSDYRETLYGYPCPTEQCHNKIWCYPVKQKGELPDER